MSVKVLYIKKDIFETAQSKAVEQSVYGHIYSVPANPSESSWQPEPGTSRCWDPTHTCSSL